MGKTIEEQIYSTFASIASSIGYSGVHGKIIAALLVAGKRLSLQELSKRTGYSLATISLSLDLLEIVGLIRKIKSPGDRRLYVRMGGDLLEGLRNALLLKIKKDITVTLMEFDSQKLRADKKTKKAIKILEREIKRLDKYIDNLSKVKMPKR